MNDNKIKILRNFKDTDPSDLKLRREIELSSLNYLIGSGYINLDTPVIEPADLFFRKSLGSTSGNTYTFTDSQNQQVSLRPDFTASIMRYAFSNSKKIENNLGKYCYSGPVFRFENNNEPNQQYQIGAEYISEKKQGYESEVILDAIKCLQMNNINEFKINLGNVGIARKYLDKLGLNNSLVEFFLTNLKLFNLKNYEEELLSKAKFQNLIKSGKNTESLSKDEIKEKFSIELQSNLGLRSQDEVVDRYFNKLSNQVVEYEFNESINKLKELLNIKLENINRNSFETELNFEDFKKLINSLLESGIQKNNICIDFSLTRNLAYYDGVVFDLIYKNELIGGGGKYDDLPKMLGYKSDYSCFGFAINISKLTDVYKNE
ncbi:MAG: ATP phosphoribosyltransferase regulatory subunit [Chloroflexota bacterium]|nr:ATP phosphoribosyltransferase regulatory subunit [Chloroflexota bacterium]